METDSPPHLARACRGPDGATTATDWFPGIEESADTRMMLLCLPPAGGGAASFSYLQPLRKNGFAVLPARYPGREARRAEPAIHEFGTLVDSLANAIASSPPARYALFGHSLGAYVAFELAHVLTENLSLPPEALFVAAAPGPTCHNSEKAAIETISDVGDQALLGAFAQIGGIPSAMLSIPDLVPALAAALRGDMNVFASYRYETRPPLNIPLTAFVGQDDVLVSRADASNWKECTINTFGMHILSGGHFCVTSAADTVRRIVADVCLP